MKSIYLNYYQPWKKLCCLLFLLTTIACNKDNNASQYYGSASMMVNGVLWETDKVRCVVLNEFACYNQKLELSLLKYSTEGYLRETYAFTKVFPGVSVQKIYPENFNNICNDTLDAVYVTTVDDGDVGEYFYNADTSGNSYLNIESYNASTKEISGSFSVTYTLLKRVAADSIAVDTIRITNGKFSTKILN